MHIFNLFKFFSAKYRIVSDNTKEMILDRKKNIKFMMTPQFKQRKKNILENKHRGDRVQ